MITPPPELVQQWHKEACKDPYNGGAFFESKTLKHIATQAARWGADTELEACCEWLDEGFGDVGNLPATLRAARRPQPPSLKEQALEALDRMDQRPTAEDQRIIRKALEALPE